MTRRVDDPPAFRIRERYLPHFVRTDHDMSRDRRSLSLVALLSAELNKLQYGTCSGENVIATETPDVVNLC